jgi:hypothetical protein
VDSKMKCMSPNINFNYILEYTCKFIFYCLQNSSNPVLREVYDKMIKPNTNTLTGSFQEGLKRVCKESKFGFLIGQITFQGLAQNVSCKIVSIPKAYYTTTASFIINRGSPYKKLFTHLWVFVLHKRNFVARHMSWNESLNFLWIIHHCTCLYFFL